MSARLIPAILFSLTGCVGTSGPSGPSDQFGPRAFLDACEDWDDWDKPAPPFRIHGRIWYAGTCGISSILVETDEGLVLFDSGTEEGARHVAANIRKLGFDPKDIGALVASHEHFDHVGGMAYLQELTGATIFAGWGASAVIKSGRDNPRDPQAGMHAPMRPVSGSVRSVRDGEIGTMAGLTVTPIQTPGHTIGAMSWSWESCDNDGCKTIVYTDSLSPVSRDNYRFSDHPEFVAEYRDGLQRLANAKCDLLITPHPSASDMLKRLRGESAWIDASGCRSYAEAVEKRLDARLDSEAEAIGGR